MKIVMLGAPGAGKGTQSKKISGHYKIPHISTGDIFRANIKSGTDLGIKAKEYIDKGLLVPDDLTIALILERLQHEDCSKGYVLDGYPRTIPQAESLDVALATKYEEIEVAINIDVPNDHIIKRMSGRRACLNCGATYHVVTIPPKIDGICDVCGSKLVLRDDDKPETVEKRLKVYAQQTEPLIEYYRQKGKLKTVDGTKGMDYIFKNIIELTMSLD